MTIENVFQFGWIIFGLLFYFGPFLIALEREHNNRKAILVLVLLTGWTFVGWVAAITWAYSNNVEAAPVEEFDSVEYIADNITRMPLEDR